MTTAGIPAWWAASSAFQMNHGLKVGRGAKTTAQRSALAAKVFTRHSSERYRSVRRSSIVSIAAMPETGGVQTYPVPHGDISLFPAAVCYELFTGIERDDIVAPVTGSDSAEKECFGLCGRGRTSAGRVAFSHAEKVRMPQESLRQYGGRQALKLKLSVLGVRIFRFCWDCPQNRHRQPNRAA